MHDPADIKIRPEKLDAIHRALLSGLLGNVGQKGKMHEYTGPRGTKFSIFPGSSLFKSQPAWLMSADLVETTRLYARTNARIRPEWIERVGVHLLKHQYSDPIWKSSSGHVLAFEQVSLYSLVIVPRRAVHYGPINPTLSRQVFIHHALVEQDFKTGAAFFKHNRELLEHGKYLQAKARRDDLVKSAGERYAFFDARVPDGIYNWALFDRWRAKAELKEPRLLVMGEQDVLNDAAGSIDWSEYPDVARVGEMDFDLEYRFDPSHEADGVTATIPLAMLNLVPARPFEWLVPGMLKEKIDALIRSLPKAVRTSFIPVPEFAQKAFDAIRPALLSAEGPITLPTISLLDALATQLGKLSGLPISASDFKSEDLPPYLKMNFGVLDDAGNTVATGRDLDELRKRLGIRARLTFASLPPTQWHRENVTRWDFGDLPERVEIRVQGISLNGYPALVDNGDSVSMRLFDSLDEARDAMRAGTRRLFMLQLAKEIKDVTRMTPRLEQMGLHYATLGSTDDLRNELAIAIADRALYAEDQSIRSQQQFVQREEAGWRRLVAAADEVMAIAEQALATYQELSLKLSEDFPPLLLESAKDIRHQLAELMPRDFLTRMPYAWLVNLPRFLKAVQIRLTKLLNAGLARDMEGIAQFAPLWRAYQERSNSHRQQNRRDPELVQYRWMLEEYRVSLFAQEMKTSLPISAKRLEQQWAKVAV
jgi:ATP-dependent helicase HrpA